MDESTIEVLLTARRIADFAREEGALSEKHRSRVNCDHMGAVIADAVLQAGLNYSTVVRPRILNILRKFPNEDRVSVLVKLVSQRRTADFLNWHHPEKISRFERLVEFLRDKNIESARDLRDHLQTDDFCNALRNINGIGPKTVDYMACLVGIDSIAVDRHVRTFAKRVGVEREDYSFLRQAFCYAADLLTLPRRDFDAWVWRKEATASSPQFSFSL